MKKGGNYDSRFDVGKASGTIIVARPLDAEQKSNYNLTVEATDGTTSISTQVIEWLMKCLWKKKGGGGMIPDPVSFLSVFGIFGMTCDKQFEL